MSFSFQLSAHPIRLYMMKHIIFFIRYSYKTEPNTTPAKYFKKSFIFPSLEMIFQNIFPLGETSISMVCDVRHAELGKNHVAES